MREERERRSVRDEELRAGAWERSVTVERERRSVREEEHARWKGRSVRGGG